MSSLPGNNDVVALWILEFLRLGEDFLNVLPSVSFSGGSVGRRMLALWFPNGMTWGKLLNFHFSLFIYTVRGIHSCLF